uniref:RRM domain-containing protein n=1 Tax=Ditylenchus dipsaci TaxID=166011 RepID=A0A915DFQ5_9BILA
MYLSFKLQIRMVGNALFSRRRGSEYSDLPFQKSPASHIRSFSMNAVDFQSVQRFQAKTSALNVILYSMCSAFPHRGMLQHRSVSKKAGIKTQLMEIAKSLADKRSGISRPGVKTCKLCKRTIFVSGVTDSVLIQSAVKFFSKFDPSVKFGKAELSGVYLKLSSRVMVKNVLDGAPYNIDGVEVHVRPLRPMNRTLFVGLLPANTVLQTLQDYFSRFGEVEFCSQKRSRAMNRPLRAAYVTFSSEDGLEKAMKARPHRISGKRISAINGYAGSFSHQSSRTTLLLDHLPLSVTEEKLEKYFTKIGELIHCEIALEPSIRGLTGRVTFDNEEGVKKALVLGPHFINGREIRVNYHAEETTVLNTFGNLVRSLIA